MIFITTMATPKRHFHKAFVFILLLFAGAPVALAQREHTEVLQRSAWPVVENGASVLSLPQISTIVEMFKEHEKVRIELSYPGGDSGRLWAESVVAWLVSFGVPQQYLLLYPGSGGADRLVIALIERP